MKNTIKAFTAGVLTSLILVTGCSTNLNNTPENVSSINNVEINANKNSTFTKKSLIVNVKEINTNQKLKVITPFSDINFNNSKTTNVILNSQIPQLITLENESGIPVGFSIIPKPDSERSTTINFQSTAEALIFMHPTLATIDKDIALRTINIIRNLNETKQLSKLLETESQKSSNYLSKQNNSIDSLITKSVQNTIDRLASDKNLNADEMDNTSTRTEGIEIKLKKQSQNIATLEVQNYKKRTVDLYFNDSLGRNIEKPLYYESIPSALKFFRGLKVGIKPFIKEVNIDLNKPEVKEVEVIGLGLKDLDEFKKSWSSFSKEEKYKYGFPIAKTFVFDFVAPILSITVGFNVNKTFESGLNQIISELPIYEIINEFSNKDFADVFKLVMKSTVNSLISNNAKLLRQLLFSGGVSFSDSILKRLNGISAVWAITKHSVEFVRALHAYKTTNIKGVLNADYSNGKISFSSSFKKVSF